MHEIKLLSGVYVFQIGFCCLLKRVVICYLLFYDIHASIAFFLCIIIIIPDFTHCWVETSLCMSHFPRSCASLVQVRCMRNRLSTFCVENNKRYVDLGSQIDH